MASLATPLFELRTVVGRSFSAEGTQLWNDLPLSSGDGSQIRANADPGTSFSALLRSCRGGLAVRVPSTLARKLPTRVRILGVEFCSQVDSKRSESSDGYSRAIKMLAVKSS